MGWRAGAMAVVTLAVAACSQGTDERVSTSTAPATIDDTTTTVAAQRTATTMGDPVGTASTVTGTAEPLSDGWGDGPFSITGAIAALPISLPLPERPTPNPTTMADGDISVTVVDLVGVGSLTSQRRPDGGDEEILTWLLALADRDSPVNPDTGVKIRLSEFPYGLGGLGSSSAFAAEFGFGYEQIDAVAELISLPSTFTVLSGPDEPGGGFVEVGPDRWTLGLGDDDERSIAEISDWRPYGQPIRAGRRGGLLAMSGSTPAIEEWLSDRPGRLIDDPRFAVAAAALDSVDAVAAEFIAYPFAAPPIDASPDGPAPITEPFSVFAAGAASRAGQPVATAVWVFDDDGAATRMEPVLRDLFARGSTDDGTRYADMFSAVEVTSLGPAVVLTAVPIRPATTFTLLQIVYLRESIGVHLDSEG